MKKLIAGNWKMNGNAHAAETLIRSVEKSLQQKPELVENCDFVVCPPFLHLPMVKDLSSVVAVGAQDCSDKKEGAYTGDTSAAMIADIGASHVILGHSERRQYHKETDQQVHDKAVQANAHNLITIICVGETDEERTAGKQNDVVAAQLAASVPASSTPKNTVIAYEPVWAIGTGKTATPDDVKEMHAFIRKKLSAALSDGASIRILYGGSVKPANAAEIFAQPNVDGALIGGASLKAEDYLGIAAAA